MSKFKILLFSFLLISTAAFSDGMIFPIHPDYPERMQIIFRPRTVEENFTVPLTVNKHHVKIEINDTAAQTQVDQVFFNNEPRVIEGLYIFPLPIGASISGFSMDIEGKLTKGELLEADKARKIYEDIVRQMRDPGLLEFMGTGIFKTRIYPIEANSEKKIKLSYQETLKSEGNLIRYVYPLKIDKFSQEPMKEVMIEAKIKSKTPITSIYSPTHKIVVKKDGQFDATVSFEIEKLKPEKDFVLYYGISTKEVGVSLLANRPDSTEDGHFMLFVTPRDQSQENAIGSKSIAFVVDTSGSMAGEKINQTKKALEYCVKSLKDDDSFFLESFATEANPYKNEFLQASDAIKKGALNYIKNLEAAGGTNISEALLTAFKALEKKEEKRPSFIVFLTDGSPTAGLTEVEEILKVIKESNSKKTRIFVFGVGDTVNTSLLDRLAEETGGTSDYVSEGEDIEVKISDLFNKLTHPVMTDVSLEVKNIDVKQIYPRALSDLFKGASLTLLGRYSNSGKAQISLSGKIGENNVKMTYEAEFPESESANPFIPKLWATRKIGYLLEQIKKNGSNDELKNELISLAKRYGILTPYTSFLVLEDKTQNGPDLRRVMVPNEPSGRFYSEEKAKFDMGRFQTNGEGADAVDASREMSAMKSAAAPSQVTDSLSSGFSGRIRNSPSKSTSNSIQKPVSKEIDDKTFFLIEGKWIDSVVKDQTPKLKIKVYSDEYFEFLKKNPLASKFVSIGDNLILMINGEVIEISS
ncbi:MAG: VWA domain-containing protein [Candidatus Riflebacteria bacterium]|nr:VWA domain-containing protein [Candidatus Riflebacteria bacterium]